MFPSRVLRNAASSAALKQETKRNPELYVLAAVMSGIFGVAGYYFGSKPTSATSEDKSINVAKMPWEGEAAAAGKYSYHPQGNSRNAPRDAPSALHSVIVPNVNLPKELHERFNKYGKDGY